MCVWWVGSVSISSLPVGPAKRMFHLLCCLQTSLKTKKKKKNKKEAPAS